MTSDSARDVFDRIPKVELHCHVEGTVRSATVIELAHRAGRPLPTEDPEALYRYDSLDSFLAIFWMIQELLITPADWARIAYESLVDAAGHGLRYREMFFTPARHLAAGQSLAGIVAGLTEGIEAAEAETHVRCMLIADMDRAYGPEAGMELVDHLGGLRRSGLATRVIGVGADSTEVGIDLLSFSRPFNEAARLGLRRTCHAGEAVGVGPGNVRLAIEGLGAERIDHGVAIVEDPQLLHEVARRGIPLTVCPSSNVVIANRYRSLAEHPLPSLREAGVLVTINTDDPAMSGLDLGLEYRRVAEAYGWSATEMGRLAVEGIESTWLDAPDRAALAHEFEDILSGM